MKTRSRARLRDNAAAMREFFTRLFFPGRSCTRTGSAGGGFGMPAPESSSRQLARIVERCMREEAEGRREASIIREELEMMRGGEEGLEEGDSDSSSDASSTSSPRKFLPDGESVIELRDLGERDLEVVRREMEGGGGDGDLLGEGIGGEWQGFDELTCI